MIEYNQDTKRVKKYDYTKTNAQYIIIDNYNIYNIRMEEQLKQSQTAKTILKQTYGIDTQEFTKNDAQDIIKLLSIVFNLQKQFDRTINNQQINQGNDNMNNFDIQIVDKIIRELKKPKKLQNWKENNLKSLHKKYYGF